jgi:rubrerythrin
MEYKICESCGAKVHSRTQKCPICNTILTEASQIVSDVIQFENENNNNNTAPLEQDNTIGKNYAMKISDSKTPLIENNNTKCDEKNRPAKDYIYKAEVHHSLEYTEPLSNLLKVVLTVFICMIPLFGQLVGLFFGIFFSIYEDKDRKSFGKIIILLSIIMFLVYAYTLMSFSQLINSDELKNLLTNF